MSITSHCRLPQEIICPEEALLLWCIREGSDRERTEQINALIRKDVDWTKLLDASILHGLVPLVCKGLESCSGKDVPKDILGRFRDHFRKIALWNLASTRELLGLLDLFTRKGIQAIPYKGPVLSAMLYGDVCNRQYSDLDFLYVCPISRMYRNCSFLKDIVPIPSSRKIGPNYPQERVSSTFTKTISW
jgi:hypothetical protein